MSFVKDAPKKFADIIRMFLASSQFEKYKPATKDLWGRELNYCIRYGLGDVVVDELRPKVVRDYLNGWADKPGKQAAALTAIKAVEKWAIVDDLLPREICLGVRTGKPMGGHIPWTDEQVNLAKTKARVDLARVVVLGVYTGQRKSDLVRMCWSDIETVSGRPGINVTQQKTAVKIWIPFAWELTKEMETWERQPGPILRRMNQAGTSWTTKTWEAEALGHAWAYELRTNDALRPLRDAGLVLHGLRGHSCVALSRAGATTRQIADLVGMSEGMVSRYTRLSDQKENATAAIDHLERYGGGA